MIRWIEIRAEGMWSRDGDPIRITDDPIRDPDWVQVITVIRR